MMAYLQYTAKRRYFWSNCYNSTEKPPFGLTSAEVAVISHLFPSMSNSVLWYKLTSSRRKCDFIISWCQHLPCGVRMYTWYEPWAYFSFIRRKYRHSPRKKKHDEICNWNVMISESHCPEVSTLKKIKLSVVPYLKESVFVVTVFNQIQYIDLCGI